MKPATFKELEGILQRDYNISRDGNQIEEFGLSLLRLTRMAVTALARVDEKNSSVQARENNSLEVRGESMQD